MACLHGPADAVERAARAVDYNVMLRVCVAKQTHILAGPKNKIAFGAVSALDFNHFILIRRMQHQKPQAAVRVEIGKFRVA